MKNYELIKEEYVKEVDSQIEIYRHIKSQARVCLLKNSDENKTFTIGFRTPPINNTGLPHILEHSVLNGSKKYPVKEPFLELIKGSLNTFLNAMTYPDKTVYPVASCNENDFRNLMSVYMDAVLYPNIYKYEEIFMQEGWHYEIQDKNDPITINGVVYNEMKGAFSSVDDVIARYSSNSLFPDNAYGFESGGDPKYIPDLSYEEFINFHKKLYHPSNSYIIIYGNCDMEAKLKWLDEEYLSEFDAISIDTTIKEQKPFDKPKYLRVEYAIGEEDDVKDKTNLSYNTVVCDATDVKTTVAFDVLSYALLSAPGAPLKEALIKAQIGNDIDGGFMSGTAQAQFGIYAKNTNEDMLEKFTSVIEDTLSKIVKEGLNKQMLLAAMNYFEFKEREANYGRTPKGLIYTINILGTWLYDDSHPYDLLTSVNYYEELRKLVDTNYFEELISKYILNNNHKSIVVCAPSKKLAKQQEEALAKKLADYKASLSEAELDELVAKSKKLKAYQNEETTREQLDTIPKLALSDINKEVAPLNNEEKEICGVKTYHQDYFTSNIAYISYMFDIRNVSNENVLYLSLLTNLFAYMDTSKHTYLELDIEEKLNTGGMGISMSTVRTKDDYKAYFTFTATVLADKVKNANDLLLEIIQTTKLDNQKRLLEIINEIKSRMLMRISASGHRYAANRCLSYGNEVYAYGELIDGLSFLDFLGDISQNFENKKEEMISKLQHLAAEIFTKDRLLINVTGSKEDYELFADQTKDFIEALKAKTNLNEKFVFEPEVLNEGIKTAYDVQFVARGGNYKIQNLPYTGALMVLKNALSADYLWQQVRVKGGAYGCMLSVSSYGEITFTSYRDPNLDRTNKVFDESVGYIKNIELSEEEVLKNIIGAIGAMDAPLHASQKGKKALSMALSGYTDEDVALERQQIINCTNKELKELAKYFEAILAENNICVIGNENKINEASSLFKTIRKLA